MKRRCINQRSGKMGPHGFAVALGDVGPADGAVPLTVGKMRPDGFVVALEMLGRRLAPCRSWLCRRGHTAYAVALGDGRPAASAVPLTGASMLS